jgi:hypothetical protein
VLQRVTITPSAGNVSISGSLPTILTGYVFAPETAVVAILPYAPVVTVRELGWRPVDDDQTGNWVPVDDSAATSWIPVNSAQTTNWTPVN